MNNQERFITEGVRAMFLSTFAFSLANVFVKQVSHIPPMEIVFFRTVIASVFCLIGLQRAGADWRGNNHTLLVLRGLFGTLALVFFFVTLQNMPLASAMTVQYLSPIFTSIIAIFVLSERVRSMQWFFYAVAFAGVLLIQQIDTRISPFYLMLGIISAFGSGVAYNLVRTLRGREHPLTIVLHFQLVGVVAGGASLFFEWRTPVGLDWLYLFFVGVASQLGQVFLTHALQREKAASVSIVNYTGMIYAIAFGWFVFGETHPWQTLVGMTLVVFGVAASVFYTSRRELAEALDASAG